MPKISSQTLAVDKAVERMQKIDKRLDDLTKKEPPFMTVKGGK